MQLAVFPKMTTPNNPDDLTPEQVGEGWRLVQAGEPPLPDAEVYSTGRRAWKRRLQYMQGYRYNKFLAYRVPVEKGPQ